MAKCDENNDRKLRYEEIPVLTRDEVEAQLASKNPMEIVVALLSASMYSESSGWVESACLQFLESPEFKVRAGALTALCHLARLHQSLNLPRLNHRLGTLEQDPAIAGYIEDLRDQIEVSMLRDRR